MTGAERVMAAHLRAAGVRFIEQYKCGPYRIDFFLSRLQMGLEIDGRHHATIEGSRSQYPGQFEYDRNRGRELARRGISTVRIPNIAVHLCGNTIARMIRDKEKGHRGRLHSEVDALLRLKLPRDHWWFTKRKAAESLANWRRSYGISIRRKNSFWRPPGGVEGGTYAQDRVKVQTEDTPTPEQLRKLNRQLESARRHLERRKLDPPWIYRKRKKKKKRNKKRVR